MLVGNDGLTLFFYDEGYVGFSPSQATVIVAHQGTNPKDLFVQFLHCSDFNKTADNPCSEAVATDLNVPFRSLDPTLFPGINSSVEAHSGFANEQAK